MRYFKGIQFKKDVIWVVIGYYCRFSLSYRNVPEILKEREVSVHPTTNCIFCLAWGGVQNAGDTPCPST